MNSYVFLFGAALGAGLMNSVAGGGSFLTFPTLVFSGVPSIIANATSTVGLFPGAFAAAWAYRHNFKPLGPVSFKSLFIVSVVGGITGALLLLYTSQGSLRCHHPVAFADGNIRICLRPESVRVVAAQGSDRRKDGCRSAVPDVGLRRIFRWCSWNHIAGSMEPAWNERYSFPECEQDADGGFHEWRRSCLLYRGG